jgi:hypothetical protein
MDYYIEFHGHLEEAIKEAVDAFTDGYPLVAAEQMPLLDIGAQGRPSDQVTLAYRVTAGG